MTDCSVYDNCIECTKHKCIFGISLRYQVQCAQYKSEFVFPRLFTYIDGCDSRHYYIPTTVWIFAGIGWTIAAVFMALSCLVWLWCRLKAREIRRFGTATGAQPVVRPTVSLPPAPELTIPEFNYSSDEASTSSSFSSTPVKNALFDLLHRNGIGGREKYLRQRNTSANERREGSAPPDIAVASVHKNLKSKFEQTVLCMELPIHEEEEETLYDQATTSAHVAPAQKWYERGFRRVSRVITRQYANKNNIKIA